MKCQFMRDITASEEASMAQVVTFPRFAPRTARRRKSVTGVDGASVFGKIIVFTGVWHERVESAAKRKPAAKAAKRKKSKS
jgi:hypothetical protein